MAALGTGAYQVGDHDLALATGSSGGGSSSSLGLLVLLGRLLDTADGGSSGGRTTASIRATAAAALASRLLARADDGLEGLVEAGFRHGGGDSSQVGDDEVRGVRARAQRG
jgi:hypothetical protein